MIGMLALIFGVAVGSALLPVLNVELFVIAAAAAHGPGSELWWAIGAAAAVGQLIGKMPYFYAARGDLRLPAFMHRKTQAVVGAMPEVVTVGAGSSGLPPRQLSAGGPGGPAESAGSAGPAKRSRLDRLAAWGAFGRWLAGSLRWCGAKFIWLRDKCREHPKWMFGTQAVSSVIGIPPFMLTTVLAGLAEMSSARFLVASLPGRFVRFAILAASPVMVSHLLHWHW